MSAIRRIADASQTLPEVGDVPISEVENGEVVRVQVVLDHDSLGPRPNPSYPSHRLHNIFHYILTDLKPHLGAHTG
jgi:hypothetical protein